MLRGEDSLDHARKLGRARVLVVDDEPMILSMLKRTLRREHDVETVENAREALRLLEGEGFDLIICDLMMPDVSGMDLYEQLLETKPAVARRIAFATGGAYTPRAREFLASTSNKVLLKPFSPDELRDFVQTFVTENPR